MFIILALLSCIATLVLVVDSLSNGSSTTEQLIMLVLFLGAYALFIGTIFIL